MKRLSVLLIFISFLSFSQEECEVLGEPIEYNFSANKNLVYTIPLSVKIILDVNGNTTLNEAGFFNQIERFNQRSQYVNLEVIETLYIQSEEYYSLSRNESFAIKEEINPETGSTYHNFETLNVYLAWRVENSSGQSLCGFAYYPSWNAYNWVTFLANSCADESTTPHEFGHLFGNFHTHGTSNNFNSTNELVDRSNCYSSGDNYCDTQADPRLSTATVTTDCEYIGDYLDRDGVLMIPDTRNYMSYSRRSCRNMFSEEQQLDHQEAAAFYCQNMNCGTLGINNETLSKLKIYPNPFNNYIELSSKVDYKLYDLTGKLVFLGNNNTIRTSSLPKGFYILKIGQDVYKLIK